MLFKIDYAFFFWSLGRLEFPPNSRAAVEEARTKAEEEFENATDPKNPNYSRLADTDKGRVYDAALRQAVASVGSAFRCEILSLAETGKLTLDREALTSEKFLELRVSDAESRRNAEFKRRLYLDRSPWIEAGGVEPSISRLIKDHEEWKRCEQRCREVAARLSSPAYLKELETRAIEKLDQNWQKLSDVFTKARPEQYRSWLLALDNNFLMQQGRQNFGAGPQEEAEPQPPIDEAVIAENAEETDSKPGPESKFAENVKQLRKDLHLSQQELAERLNLSREQVHKHETRQAIPHPRNARSYAELFSATYSGDFSVNDILNREIKKILKSRKRATKTT